MQNRLSLRKETLLVMESRTANTSSSWNSSLAPDQAQLDAVARSITEIRAEIVETKILIASNQVSTPMT